MKFVALTTLIASWPHCTLMAAEPCHSAPLEHELRDHCLTVLRVGLQSDEFWPAIHAAEALTLAGNGVEVVSALKHRLATERDDQQRCGLARELVRAGNRDSLSILFEILGTAGSNGRVHAAESLYKLGAVGDGRLLHAAFQQNEHLPLQLYAAGALASVGDPQALKHVREQLLSENPSLRHAAVLLLARLGMQQDMETLANLLEDERDATRRVGIVCALACLGHPRQREELGRSLGETDAAVRVVSAEFVGHCRGVEHLAKLIGLLDDSTLDVRVRAAQSIIALSLPAPAIVLARQTVVKGGGHFPVLIRLRNAELAAVLRGKFAHVLGDASLDIIRSADDGQTWSAPRVAVDAPDEDDRNPAFGQLADGTLILAYMRYDVKNNRSRGTWAVRSRDNGHTWDEPTPVYLAPDKGHCSPHGKIVQLPDGTALLSLYASHDLRKNPSSNDGAERAWLLRSRDSGRTWSDPSVIAEGFNETGLTVIGEKTLLAALRKSPGPEYDSLSLTRSDDGGRTWSRPQQITVQGEHPGDLIGLGDGRLLLSYGVRHDPDQPFAGYDKDASIAHQMGVEALSSDDLGATWKHRTILDYSAPNYDCGYPSSVQLDDGRIVTIYYLVAGKADYDLAGAQTRTVIWKPRHEPDRQGEIPE